MKKNMTTAQVLTTATDKLAGDISQLTAKRDQSLSIFRQTAQNLEAINAELAGTINKMDDMMQFIATQKEAAGKVIADNNHVTEKIYDIIGR
jgi:phage-related minor tail protein